MNGYLELADGGLIGARDGLTVGRVAACDVVIDDTKASRRHARLIVESGVVEVEDLNSSNGTLLNGKPVTKRVLRGGDVIRIGKTELVYREGAMPGSGPRSKKPAAPVFDDDDDLLGGPAVAPPKAVKPSIAADGDGDGDDADDALFAAPPAAPKAAPSMPEPPKPVVAKNVVEFEDEVVEVEKTAPVRPESKRAEPVRPTPIRPEPKPPRPSVAPARPRQEEPDIEITARPRDTAQDGAAGAGAAGASGRRSSSGSSSSGAGDLVASEQRVLQFSKKVGGKGMLGDDLGQMSGGSRALLVVLAIAAGAGIIWGISVAMA
ncbi:MAG: FHA domain-containing protein [Planctomycetota bacterium]